VNAPLASGGDSALVFAWDHPRRRRAAITGFLFASVGLHALCFYAFQIIYPPAVALLPPPGRVTVIAPNTEEGRVLLRWLEAEDPALASTTQRPADGKSLAMPTVQHAPSYLTWQPTLKPVPASPPDPAIPSAQPPAPVEPSHPPIQAPARIAPTIMRLSAELGALVPRQGPELKFMASGHNSPQPAQFRVAVNENGALRYCFLEKSSGDAALDEQAREHLASSRFSAPRNPQAEIRNDFVWGTVTVEWGKDLFAPASARESVAP